MHQQMFTIRISSFLGFESDICGATWEQSCITKMSLHFWIEWLDYDERQQ